MINQYGNDMSRDQHNIENANYDKTVYAGDNSMVNDAVRRDATKDKVLIGVFDTENDVINVIRELKEKGYSEDEITILAKHKEQMEHIDENTNTDTKSSQNASGAGAGATIGAVLGGLAAAVPALGLLIIPGIGPLLAAGPIVAILGGVVAGGVAGGLLGALVQMGVTEEDAKKYESYIDQGKILVLVENRENLREDVNSTFRANRNITDQTWN